MIISARIKKVRELRGLKQTTVAASMNISQQAYSCLEQGAGNARLDTLKRFCSVMNIELSFLIAIDVPVTDETIDKFGSKSYNDLILNYKKMEQKLEIYEELLTRNMDAPVIRHSDKRLTASVQRA